MVIPVILCFLPLALLSLRHSTSVHSLLLYQSSSASQHTHLLRPIHFTSLLYRGYLSASSPFPPPPSAPTPHFPTRSPHTAGGADNEYAFEMASAMIRFGEGVTGEVGMDVNNLGIKKLCVVTDKNVSFHLRWREGGCSYVVVSLFLIDRLYLCFICAT